MHLELFYLGTLVLLSSFCKDINHGQNYHTQTAQISFYLFSYINIPTTSHLNMSNIQF